MPLGPRLYDIPYCPRADGTPSRKVFAMLTSDTLHAFVQRDTRTVADALIGGSLLGTAVGDRVLAVAANYPERHAALIDHLARRGAWEAAA